MQSPSILMDEGIADVALSLSNPIPKDGTLDSGLKIKKASCSLLVFPWANNFLPSNQ